MTEEEKGMTEEEKGMTEEEMDDITNSMDMSFSKLGAGGGQGGLVCCSPWGRKELDTTERLN